MAIAIKKGAGSCGHGDLVERFGREKRTAIKLTCPEITCGQGYMVYFDCEISEDDIRAVFDQRAKQQHPFHPEVCAFDEPLPPFNPDLKTLALTVTPPVTVQLASQSVAVPHLPPRRYVPAEARPSVRNSPALPVAIRVLARCAALVVAAVPLLTRGSKPL